MMPSGWRPPSTFNSQWDNPYSGWRVAFRPIPKSPEARGVPGLRPVAAIADAVHITNPETALRDAVTSKAGAYGDPPVPYVVAVNCLHEFTDRIAVSEALFGKEVFEFGPGPEVVFRREPNGALVGATGAQNTRVSAVLVGLRVSPATFPRAGLRLYHNPFARRSYRGPLDRLARAVPAADQLRFEEGESLAALFGVPDGWPGTWEDE